jgi:adenosylcobinamide kinase/adenosylcobinamide-phosphate guanylyltransferase
MSRVIMVTGGSRSGKTAYALSRARAYSRRTYIATAEAIDDEMRARIARHRAERRDEFDTMEAPHALAAALRAVPAGTGVAVVDCLTVWLGNLMHRHGVRADYYPEMNDLLAALERPPCDVILVTNEIGLGIVPADAMTRAFRDLAGWLNQDVARRADVVALVVSGLPLLLKGA